MTGAPNSDPPPHPSGSVEAPLPPDEEARLGALRDLNVLDTAAEPQYDALTRLAALICGTPIAAISLVDETRQWFKSSVGLDVSQTARRDAFCAHTILTEGPMLVNDALDDPRFVANELVTGEPHIRFYVGIPLHDHDGHALGALCVIDHTPRSLDGTQLQALRDLAIQVEAQLALRRLSQRLSTTVAQAQERVAEMQLLVLMARDLALCSTRTDVLGVVLRTARALMRMVEGQPARAMTFHVENGTVTLEADFDEAGDTAAGTTFPLVDHPYIREATTSGRTVSSMIDVDRFGPVPAEAIRRLGIAAGTWVPSAPNRRSQDTVIAFGYRDVAAVDRVKSEWVDLIAPIARIGLENAERLEALSRQARRDPLTDLGNRRAFDDAIAALPRTPFAIVALDVDGLKALNDTEGHARGDELIVAVARAVEAEKRRGDVAARVGGDEFALLMIGGDAAAAAVFIHRVRGRLAGETGARIGISAGAAAGYADDDPREVWRVADELLYRDKRQRQAAAVSPSGS